MNRYSIKVKNNAIDIVVSITNI